MKAFYDDVSETLGGDFAQGEKGIVTNIQRFTVHDGPGIRTEVFLKGCPLRCLWCFNPESFHPVSEVGVFPKKCIGTDKCSACMKACPDGERIFQLGKDKGFDGEERTVIQDIDRSVCTNCLECAQACPAEALKVWGRVMTVQEVMDEVLKERPFYEEKGGGITISGGELLVQWRFALALLRECKRQGIHTCIESTLLGDWTIIEQLLQYTDFIFTDIKHMDPQKHLEYTAVSNRMILENIRKIAGLGIPAVIRIPLIPRHNDSEENIRASAEFIRDAFGDNGATLKQVQLLGFHQLGHEKYESIGLAYPLREFVAPPHQEYKENLEKLAGIMAAYGVPAVVGANKLLGALRT
jgi:pyruvate formate lyase activating enzyme